MVLNLTISLEFEATALMDMNHDVLAEEIAQKLCSEDYWSEKVCNAIEAADGNDSEFIDVFAEAEEDAMKMSVTPKGAQVNTETCTPEAIENNLVILDILYVLDLDRLKAVSDMQAM